MMKVHHDAQMRTTVDLPEDLHRIAASLARDTDRSLSQVVEYLMRRDGNVASKREILDHVWGMDFAGDPNVVEVYIGYLRRKIDQPFDGQLIRTVRGAGYRLCPE